jgi:O-antigen ligase/tetratricopeptide (TPR) repeat protein
MGIALGIVVHMKKKNQKEIRLYEGVPLHTWLSSLLFCGALVASLFFNGSKFEFLAISQILLLSVFLVIILTSYKRGIKISRTFLALSVTLFWSWLLLSSQFLPNTPALIFIDFWWLGTLPMVFWLYTLQPNANTFWKHACIFILLLGTILSIVGIYDFFVLREFPREPFLYKNLLGAFLNIIILIWTAKYLIRSKNRDNELSAYHFYVLASLFLLIYTVVLINSRGILLSLAVAFALLLSISYHLATRKKPILIILAVIICASLLGTISSKLYSQGADVTKRITTLQQPYNAGKDRFIIWEASFNLLKQSPWLGAGLGTYSLRYPPYRHPEDGNFGAYVHNDYLQIWIEGGLPALLFLVFIMISASLAFLKSISGDYLSAGVTNGAHPALDTIKKGGDNRHSRRGAQNKTEHPVIAKPADKEEKLALHKVEITGLFACLIAIALHSFFDFNLYTVPTMIMLGLVLGRFHYMTTQNNPHIRQIEIDSQKYLKPYAFRAISVIAVIMPMLYLAGVGVAMHQYNRGLYLVGMGEGDEALKCFRVAGSFWRSSDAPYFCQATVIKLKLQQISKGDFADRKTEFERAETLLSEAEKRNPLRPEIYYMRGLLYLENRDLAGPSGTEKAAANFEKALKLNPLFYHARVAYASLLGKAGKEQEALKVLKDGLHYTYTLNADILPYLKMSAKVLERFADYENLKGLPEKINSIEGK